MSKDAKKFWTIVLLLAVLGIGLLFVLKPYRLNEVKPPLRSEENTEQKQATTSSVPTLPPPAVVPPPPTPAPTPQPPAPPPAVKVLPEINIGNTAKKQVIFTFDAGAGSQSADKVLQTLAKYKVKGTFFFTGQWAEENSNLAKQIAGSHEVFNHTYSHPDLTKIPDSQVRNELQKGDQVISSIIGRSTKPYFRPPYGARNSHLLQIAAEEGYRSVYWTIDALDWKESQGYTAAQSKERILSNLKPGAIYLMHLGDNITGEILEDVFSQIKAQGYNIVSLSEGIK